MKKQYFYKISTPLIVLATIIAFEACQKNNSYISNPVSTAATNVTASVSGLVTDTNNIPVTNATVTAGSSAITTDANGLFILKDVQLIKTAGFVKITKPGYFDGSRTFLVNTNTINNIKIELIPKTVSGKFASASGGNINIFRGGTINFSGSSIVNATTNISYSGDVSVSTFYLNPSDAHFSQYMPGDLRGINSSDKENILKSFGMVSVEMDNGAGEKLQLANGKTATIIIPIPWVMLSSAPSTISLWYFDDTKGIWKEEGSANKQGTNYIGTVKHFSFWTAAQAGADIRLDATFKVDSSSAIALVNKLVTITSVNYGTSNGYTDNNGTVSGLIPANEPLVVKIFNDCSDLIYSQNIGPFTTDANLGTIKISGSNLFYTLSTITITGTVINCSNSPVSNGSVQITSGSSHFDSPINNGNFSLTFTRCSNLSTPLTLIPYDAATGMSGKSQTINTSGGTLNVGQIIVCTPITADFVYYVSGSTPGPFTVTFTNTSTNGSSYVWDFGDGSTSTIINPSHTYTIKGNYSVTLTATGNSGTSTITKVIAVPDESYINLTMNGTTYSWTWPDSISAVHIDTSGGINHTLIQANSTNKWIYFYILNDNALPGNYSVFPFYAFINSNNYSITTAATTTITGYGAIGNYISGTLSGQFDSITNIPFTLDYKVKRLQ